MPVKKFIPSEMTEKFIEFVEKFIKEGTVKDYKEIADSIGLSQPVMSLIKNGHRDLPYEYSKTFQERYNVVIFSKSQEEFMSHIEARLSDVESQLEVFETAIAQLLLPKSKLDLMETVEGLRTKVAAAKARRSNQQRKRS